MAASAYYAQVQQLYVAYFGRPADKLGLEYYAKLLDANGGNDKAMLHDFANSAESKALYNQTSLSAKVASMYVTLFGREGDIAGITYWASEVQAGKVLLSEVAAAIAFNAQAADKAAFSAKLAAADAFTAKIDTTAELVAYETNPSVGRTWLSSVKDETTKTSAAATIDATLTAAVNGTNTTAGQTFTLTTGIDTLNGTTGNDTFVTDNASASAADTINGGEGVDTLKLVGTTTKVAVSSIEKLILDNTAANATFDASTLTGLTSVTLSNHSTDATDSNAKPTTLTLSADQALTLENVQSGDADAGFAQIKYAASVAASTVTLNKAGDAATNGVALTVDLDGAGVKTLNLTTTGTASNIVLDNTDSDIAYETINITGDKNLKATVAASSATKVTVAAGNFTGALNLDLSATEDFEVTAGSGNDRVNFGAALTTADKYNGGTGTDTLATSVATVNAAFAAIVDAKTNGVNNIQGVDVLEYTGTAAYVLDASVIQNVGILGYTTTGAIAAAADTVGIAVTGQSNKQSFSIEANVTGGAGNATQNGAKGITFAPAVNNGDNTLNLSLKGVEIKGGAGKATNGNGGDAADFSNFETINITSTGATATAVNKFTGGALAGTGTDGATVVVSANAKLNITGTNELNLGAISSANQPVTVDATGLSGKLTVGTGSGADVIKGGSGVNIVTLAGGADMVDLAKSVAKADTINVTSATATSVSGVVAIAGFTNAATTGDKLDIFAAGQAATVQADVAAGTATGIASLTAAVGNGIITFAGSAAATATLTQKVTAALSTSFANSQYEVVAFEHNGNTYVVGNGDGNTTLDAGADFIVELTGVTGLTTISGTASAANTLFLV